MPTALLLIDMDAFYAAVEQARRPELRGRPVIVGGSAERRGVVSTASYEARACGVRTAMSTGQALRLCPQAVFLSVDMPAYLAAQQQVLAIFARYTDLIEPVSIDEAFLDVTGCRRLFGSAEQIAAAIQRAVRDELALSCSIGIAPTKLLAKLAAELHKPGGIGSLSGADVHGRLRRLPVDRLSGIGPVTAQRLAELHVSTIGELQDIPRSLLASVAGEQADVLKQLAFGGPDDPVRAGREAPKSLGRELTFAADVDDPDVLHATLLELADAVAARLRANDLAATTVTLKLRDTDFRTCTRQRRLSEPACSTRPLYEAVVDLLERLDRRGRAVRLLGVSASGLCPAAQLSLVDPWRQTALDAAVDRVRGKYGSAALRLAGCDLPWDGASDERDPPP